MTVVTVEVIVTQIPSSPIVVTATQVPSTNTPVVVTATPESGLCPEVMRSSAGRILLTAQIGEEKDSTQMFLMDGEGRSLCPLEIGPGYEAKWSPDGKYVAYSLQSDTSEIMLFNIETQQLEQLTKESGAYDPAWSPDGQQVAFQNGSANLFVINKDSSNQRPLTNGEGWNEAPAWSPDGSRIAFASNRDMPDDSNGFEIYVMDVDGDNIRRLTNNNLWDHMPAWSPDGSQLVFASGANQGQTDLFVMDADCDGCDAENITNNGFANQNPVWLAGNRIAYEADERSGDHGVYVIQLETGDIERITRPVLQVMGFDWWAG
jgi:TolB protein